MCTLLYNHVVQKCAFMKEVYLYEIDRDNRILSVSDSFVLYGMQNNYPDISKDALVGKPLLDFFADNEIRHLYESVIDLVRKTGKSSTVPFRCDSPEEIRQMELEISPLDDGKIRFRSVLVDKEPRKRMDILDSNVSRAGKLLVMCSWCKRIAMDNMWIDLDRAAEETNLFNTPKLPPISHAMCPTCESQVEREFGLSQ